MGKLLRGIDDSRTTHTSQESNPAQMFQPSDIYEDAFVSPCLTVSVEPFYSQLLVDVVQIHGIKIEAVIDSGATCSLIHATLAKALDLTIVEGFPISLKFGNSDNQIARNIAMTHVTYRMTSYSLPLYVSDSLPFQLLLGLNFLKSANIRISFYEYRPAILQHVDEPLPAFAAIVASMFGHLPESIEEEKKPVKVRMCDTVEIPPRCGVPVQILADDGSVEVGVIS